MKKIIISMLFVLGIFGFTIAQKAPVKTTAKTTKVVEKKEDKTVKKSTGVTKDGTPDMRLKVNKEAAKKAPVGPTKKDGTADMRYKANKKK